MPRRQVALDPARIRYLYKRFDYLGDQIRKSGFPEISEQALEVSEVLKRLSPVSPSDRDLASLNAGVQGLSQKLEFLMSAKALARVIEDVWEEVLQPTGRRASNLRVASRYAGATER
jgi:hypothetical protein